MTYTQWNRKSTDAAIATSKDLITWTKHGNAFANASNGKYPACPGSRLELSREYQADG